MGEHNFPVLLGEGVDDETLKGIINIIESNEYVNEVSNVRTILIGSDKFKLVAEISYDIDVKLSIKTFYFYFLENN